MFPCVCFDEPALLHSVAGYTALVSEFRVCQRLESLQPIVFHSHSAFCVLLSQCNVGTFLRLRPQSLLIFVVMEGDRCQCCDLINVRKRSVSCTGCGGSFHLTCVGLTRAQAEAIPRWLCAECRGQASGINPPVVRQEVDLVSYISQCRSRLPVLAKVPRGAVVCVAEALQQLLDQAMQEKSSLSWGRLLAFCYFGIRHPDRADDGRGKSVSLATRVRTQVAAFMSCNGLPDPPDTQRVRKEKGADQHLGKRVSAKLSDGDVKGAVRLLSSEEDQAPRDDMTYNLLTQKHPPAPDNLSMPTPADDNFAAPVLASEEDVRKALASFRPGSAGGPDGLRPGHLKTLTARSAAEAGVRLLASLTEFVNLTLGGEIPDFARSVFYGASLCALTKKDGGVRPIAVGNTLRRLATKVGARSMSSTIGDSLRPVQLGYSTRGGCEAAAHAARRYLRESTNRRVILKVDMANAFNSLRRDVFLSAARVRAPALYRLLWQAYSESTTLFFGERNLVSATGIQQGDPFGPALFSLGIDDLTREIDTEFNVWYLDDGTLGGSPESVISSVERLIGRLRGVGLEMNDKKCQLMILHHSGEDALRTVGLFRGLLPEVEVVSEAEGSLLGAPLSEEGLAAAVSEKCEDLRRMVSRLELIESHQAFALLKSCFAIPKLQYILRASPAYRQVEDLARFDETLVAALTTVTNVCFDGSSLEQAVLPVGLGGLGIRRAKDIALPAFISSLYSVGELVEAVLQNVLHLAGASELQSAEDDWRERVSGRTLADDADRCRQKTWDLPLAEGIQSRLLESADQVMKARITASACRESGLWLHALPVPTIGTLLEPETFRIALAMRVGAKVCEPHKCRCGREMDSRGLHGLSCKYSAGRHPRHAALNDIIKRGLQKAGIPSILEPLGIDRGDGKRPDGITAFPFSRGKSLCWDATCVDTYAECNLNNSAVAPGSAARGAEDAKRRKYAALGARFIFEPIAVETTGVYGSTTAPVIAEIGRRITGVMAGAEVRSGHSEGQRARYSDGIDGWLRRWPGHGMHRSRSSSALTVKSVVSHHCWRWAEPRSFGNASFTP